MDFVYVHRLSPFVFQVPLFEEWIGLRWYGLAYIASFVLFYLYLSAAARRGEVRGLDGRSLDRLVLSVMAGVVIGGRLGFVLQHPQALLADPWFAFRVWEGGMAFFGGLAGVLLAIAWTARCLGIRLLEVTDVGVFPAALGLGLGRVANFINAELVGVPTGGGWGVVFPSVDPLPRHPSQLYEAASHFLMFALLLTAARRCKNRDSRHAGRISALFLLLYGGFRFVTDFYREDDVFLGPFSTGQWASLLVFLIGTLLWVRLRRCPAERTPE